jgi:hypothetical protein
VTAVELALQAEIDRDILAFVREMEQLAPVSVESIVSFETVTRRRRVLDCKLRDRIAYLVRAGLLKSNSEWRGGEQVNYTITALGMDVLDGNAPPPNWRPEGGQA